MMEPLNSPINAEKSGNGNTVSPVRDEERQTLYVGKVELSIAAPVDIKIASIIYSKLQTIPELKILLTRGTIGRGATITIELDKPTPLIETLSHKLPNVEIIPEKFGIDSIGKTNPNLQSTAMKEAIQRITVVSKGA